jgi:hypothetical protein
VIKPIGLLFNPIELVYLSKGVWVFIDFVAAMFVVISHEEPDNGYYYSIGPILLQQSRPNYSCTGRAPVSTTLGPKMKRSW